MASKKKKEIVSNTEVIKGEWKILEYWRGSFYFIDNKRMSSAKWRKSREDIISYCKEEAEQFMEQFEDSKISSNEKIQVIQPEDDNGKKIMDSFNFPLKYIQFPLIRLDLDSFKCKIGIRINICANPNLSKIFIYLIAGNEKNHFTNVDLQKFKDLAKQYVEKLNNNVFEIYKSSILRALKFKMRSTPYHLEVYNLGSTSKLIKEFVSNNNIERMKDLLKHPEVKHAYYTMLSLAGENFDKNKNSEQLKKELREQPKQALIPSNYLCDSFYVRSLYAQPEADNNYKPIMLAGITAIDLDSINSIDWNKVKLDRTNPQSPFCRIKNNNFTPIEAWHHATSRRLVNTFATL